MKLVLFFLCGASFLSAGVLLAQNNSQSSTEPICEIRNVGDCGVTAPKPVYHPDPEYTDRARRKKINGSVVVSFIVTEEGKVRDSEVKRGLEKDLDQQALAGEQVEVRTGAEGWQTGRGPFKC